MTIPRILSIAGSDPSGGAGIQADIKAISANGGYAMAALTALTAQNTRGVRDVYVVPASFVTAQLAALSEDVEIDAVKIGMLASADTIEAVAAWLDVAAPPLVILDPVMVATSGDRLLDASAERALLRLLPRATVLTPNIGELAVLHGTPPARGEQDALRQASELAQRTGVAVLAKGGHLDGPCVTDLLVTPGGEVHRFSDERIVTDNTHGTGCSLSAAIATLLPRAETLASAVARARRWLRESLEHAVELEVGGGHGPVHHFAGLWQRGGTETPPAASTLRAEWWNGIRDVRAEIDALPFVRGLAEGSLDREHFLDYVAQDAHYLGEYARVLSLAAGMAPTSEERAFWSSGAQGAIEGELELHVQRWGERPLPPATPTTRGYIDHLLASSREGYAVLVAAVLPCSWLYTDLGRRLRDGSFGELPLSPAHPYASWLETYDDPSFALANERAVSLVTRLAAASDAATRERMWRAFRASAAWEREFFDQTRTTSASRSGVAR